MSDLEPLAVALKFGFLAVLYLFLLWVTRMALRDLRGAASPGLETGYHEVLPGEPSSTDAWLIVEEGGGLTQGERFDLFGGHLPRPLARRRHPPRRPLRLGDPRARLQPIRRLLR